MKSNKKQLIKEEIDRLKELAGIPVQECGEEIMEMDAEEVVEGDIPYDDAEEEEFFDENVNEGADAFQAVLDIVKDNWGMISAAGGIMALAKYLATNLKKEKGSGEAAANSLQNITGR